MPHSKIQNYTLNIFITDEIIQYMYLQLAALMLIFNVLNICQYFLK